MSEHISHQPPGSTPPPSLPPGLPGRLIAATLEILAERDLDELSLRGVARRAGVSHTAPLRHFAGFSELLAETAAHGFGILAARVDEAGAALPAGSGARARLSAASHAYVATAVEWPELFALMFRFDLINLGNEAFQSAAASAYRQFLRLVRALQDEGWNAEVDTAVANATVWGLVHGLAVLWSQGPLAASIGDAANLRSVVQHGLDQLLS